MRKKLSTIIYQWEGLIFNTLIFLYFLLIAPIILPIASNNHSNNGSFLPIWGTILLILSILELYALPKKIRYVSYAVAQQHKPANFGISVTFLWVGHAVVSLILSFSILAAFGYNVSALEEGHHPWWLMTCLIVITIKEIYFFLVIISIDDDTINKNVKYERPSYEEWIVDFILLLYSCVVYTTIWQVLTTRVGVDVSDKNIILYALNSVAYSFLFLIIYMPLRIPYYLEEFAQLNTASAKVKLGCSIVFVIIMTIFQL